MSKLRIPSLYSQAIDAGFTTNGTYEQLEAFIKPKFDTEVNAEHVSKFESIFKEQVPGYKPLTPEQKQERRELHERAKQLIPLGIYKSIVGKQGYSAPGISRENQALFLGMGNSASENERKAEITRIFQKGSAEERHALFRDTMERMSAFDADEYQAMSIGDKIDHMGRLMPLFQLGSEGQLLLSEFKKMNCGITQEESYQFQAMYEALIDANKDMSDRLSVVMDPYYAELDLSQIPRDGELRDRIEDAALEEGLLPDDQVFLHLANVDEHQANEDIKISEIARSDFKKQVDIGSADPTMCERDGTKKANGTIRLAETLRNGGPLYMTLTNEKLDVQTLVYADLGGNGFPTRITMEQARRLENIQAKKPREPEKVEEPGKVTRFFDSINRFFGGKGLKSVNQYVQYVIDKERYAERRAEYEADRSSFTAEVLADRQPDSLTGKFNKAVSAFKEASKQREASRQAEPAKMTKDEKNAMMLAGMFTASNGRKMKGEQEQWMTEHPEAARKAFEQIKKDFLEGRNTENLAPEETQYMDMVNGQINRYNDIIRNDEAAARLKTQNKDDTALNIAVKFLNKPQSVTVEEKQWVSENMEIVRDTFVNMKDTMTGGTDAVLPDNQQRFVDKIETNIKALNERIADKNGATHERRQPERQKVNEDEPVISI